MQTDGTYTGVVDSTDDGLSRVIFPDAEPPYDNRLMATDRLPEDARHEDAIVRVTVEHNRIQDIVYDPEETEKRQKEAQSRFDRLSDQTTSEPGIWERIDQWMRSLFVALAFGAFFLYVLADGLVAGSPVPWLPRPRAYFILPILVLLTALWKDTVV